VTEGDPAASAQIGRGTEVLGTITCGPVVRRGRDGRGPDVDPTLLATLARQAAMAIHNARLAAELAARLAEIQATTAELAASRSRIVAAHESARRQIQRDIHDGAQQELVALIAGIGLARHQLGRDPGGVDDALAHLQTEAADALENLRQLAAGIHPSVLTDHGLVEAIEIRSARLPLAVIVGCEPTLRHERFSDAVEGAAYFFVSEALTNTLKHAAASRVEVRIVRSEHELQVSVTDDGVGFDVPTAARTGLRGIADRVEAIGGSMIVSSAPGSGTELTMRLPFDDRATV
jgi:signal transduction histidine kinase